MKHESADIIIIGGGVLGLSLAYHLSRSPGRIFVLESEDVFGAHASGKNAGMIRQLYRHPRLTEWTKRSIAGWPEELRRKHFQKTGSLIVGRSVPDHHQEIFQQTISHARANQELPAVYTENDGLLDSPGYVQDLAVLCKQQRVELRSHAQVEYVDRGSDRWRVYLRSGVTFSSTILVNAAGAWLNSFLNPVLQVPTQPFARHLFLVEGWPENFMPERDCGFYWNEVDEWYMRRWGKTERLVSICDRVASTPDTFVPSNQLKESIASLLTVAVPEIAARLSLKRHWHCFRTYTEDQLPVVGEDPVQLGLFWFAAFGGFGMSTSFGAAEYLCSLIKGKTEGIEPDFLPDRLLPSVQAMSRLTSLA